MSVSHFFHSILATFSVGCTRSGTITTFIPARYADSTPAGASSNATASLGFTPTEELEQADIVILNTCAIRENAHDKLYGFLGRCKHEKEKNNSDLIIGICGCMAQEENVVEELMSKHKYVDIVFGTHNIHELQELILSKKEKQNIQVYSCEGNVYENISYKRDSNIKAWVNIQYGCDKFCTYCIVPYTRGKQRSRRSCEILKEVEQLKVQGYKEITLLGQNVNAYGKDLGISYDMANLLEDVAKTGIPRVRFVTSHPWDFSDTMLEVIAKYDNIMPYIHLPLQSGSSSILKKMGRRYTKEQYKTLFYKIKNLIPNVSITTDIIVGFPGETDEDFEDTIELAEELKYDLAYTFIYSPREGTPASVMKDDTSEEVHYITWYTEEGIFCRKAGQTEGYAWSIPFENKNQYDKVMEFIGQLSEETDFRFTVNQNFWEDFLKDEMDIEFLKDKYTKSIISDSRRTEIKVSNFKEYETTNYKFVPEPTIGEGGMRILKNGQSVAVFSVDDLKIRVDEKTGTRVLISEISGFGASWYDALPVDVELESGLAEAIGVDEIPEVALEGFIAVMGKLKQSCKMFLILLLNQRIFLWMIEQFFLPLLLYNRYFYRFFFLRRKIELVFYL